MLFSMVGKCFVGNLFIEWGNVFFSFVKRWEISVFLDDRPRKGRPDLQVLDNGNTNNRFTHVTDNSADHRVSPETIKCRHISPATAITQPVSQQGGPT